jgi:hypothetical protein
MTVLSIQILMVGPSGARRSEPFVHVCTGNVPVMYRLATEPRPQSPLKWIFERTRGSIPRVGCTSSAAFQFPFEYHVIFVGV